METRHGASRKGYQVLGPIGLRIVSGLHARREERGEAMKERNNMSNKMRWDRPRGLTQEPNFNEQPYTKHQRKADRKWIKKQRKKAQKIADAKAGVLPSKRLSGAQKRKLKRRQRDNEFIEEITGLSLEEAESRWN